MKNRSIRELTKAAAIAAVYVTLTLLIAPFSYGTIQFRVSEALTVLPVVSAAAVPGLTVGCFLSNLIGMSMNPAGAWDLIVGTLATLFAALLSRYYRDVRVGGLPLLSLLFPVVINAVMIGTEMALLYDGVPLLAAIGWVALGQFGACVCGGLILWLGICKTGAQKYL